AAPRRDTTSSVPGASYTLRALFLSFQSRAKRAGRASRARLAIRLLCLIPLLVTGCVLSSLASPASRA
ncbi:MAG: hypothetical protein WCH20_09875, partial [Nitrospira sp.]